MLVDDAYRRFFPLIRERCRRVLQDPAEAQDVAQDTFVRLWKSRVPLQDDEATMKWVYRTSANLSLDVLRRREVRARVQPEAQAPAPHDEVYAQRQVLHALATEVGGDEWQAAVLTRLDGLDQAEASRVLGCSERTIRRLLERFDARARPFLNPEAP
jgi:RNA polymerase sigma-70 factor (ECF subfamily)